MNTQDFWPTYVGAITPLEFMYRFKTQDPEIAVKQYMATYPTLYGITLRGDWRTTFKSAEQYNREQVAGALLAHLQENQAQWTSQLARIFEEESRPTAPEEDTRDPEPTGQATDQDAAPDTAEAKSPNATYLQNETSLESNAPKEPS